MGTGGTGVPACGLSSSITPVPLQTIPLPADQLGGQAYRRQWGAHLDTATGVASAVPSRWARCTELAGDSQRYNAHRFSDGGTVKMRPPQPGFGPKGLGARVRRRRPQRRPVTHCVRARSRQGRIECKAGLRPSEADSTPNRRLRKKHGWEACRKSHYRPCVNGKATRGGIARSDAASRGFALIPNSWRAYRWCQPASPPRVTKAGSARVSPRPPSRRRANPE
jgi:hypothetical protein